MAGVTESVVEEAALAWLESVGWRSGTAPRSRRASSPPSATTTGRWSWRSGCAMRSRGSTALPAEALEDAFRKLTRPEGAELVARNRALHRLLVDGVTVEYRDAEGEHPRRAGAGDRLRRPGEQRLAGGQPVHRGREQAQRAGRTWCCSSTACRWR